MSRRSIPLLLVAAALLACQPFVSEEAFPSKLDTEVTLGPGERAVFSEEKLEIRFVGIAEDSRCPVDLTCVWAGEVRVKLAIRKASGENEEHEIREGESAEIDSYRVSVLDVDPQPVSTEKLQLNRYRVTLKVERVDPAAVS